MLLKFVVPVALTLSVSSGSNGPSARSGAVHLRRRAAQRGRLQEQDLLAYRCQEGQAVAS